MGNHITTRNENDKTMHGYIDYLPFIEKELEDSSALIVDFWRFRMIDEIQRLRTKIIVTDQMPVWKAREKQTQKYITLGSKINDK